MRTGRRFVVVTGAIMALSILSSLVLRWGEIRASIYEWKLSSDPDHVFVLRQQEDKEWKTSILLDFISTRRGKETLFTRYVKESIGRSPPLRGSLRSVVNLTKKRKKTELVLSYAFVVFSVEDYRGVHRVTEPLRSFQRSFEPGARNETTRWIERMLGRREAGGFSMKDYPGVEFDFLPRRVVEEGLELHLDDGFSDEGVFYCVVRPSRQRRARTAKGWSSVGDAVELTECLRLRCDECAAHMRTTQGEVYRMSSAVWELIRRRARYSLVPVDDLKTLKDVVAPYAMRRIPRLLRDAGTSLGESEQNHTRAAMGGHGRRTK